MAFLLAVLLSFGPGLFYAYIAYSMDHYEKEPLRLVVGAFLWGAVAAVIGALILSLLLQAGIYAVTESEALTELAGGSIVAPIVEEIYKGIAVLFVYLIWRHEFDSVLDGIIYAGIVALGFAATENVLYLYFAGYGEGGLAGMLALFFLRVVLGGWNHAFFTAFFGIGLAIRRLSHKGFIKVAAPLIGLLLAMLTHAAHNSIIALAVARGGAEAAGAAFAVTVLYNWIGWAFIFVVMLWALRREHAWMTRYLQDEVRLGVMTPAQYEAARSFWGRFGARFRGKSGTNRRFYQLAAELAQKKYQLARFGDERGNAAAVERLRGELALLATKVPA
jgi:RsiW-degrading membrane proteinase PrsW (M82 family)